MLTLFKVFGSLALVACTATALEKDFVDRIVQSAQNIERDATTVDQALKNKQFDSGDVTRKLDGMDADVAKLKELVKELDSTDPKLSDRDRVVWDLVKQKVQLIEIFHGQKKVLAAEDFGKHRNLIRAHAKGLVLRAQKLQQSAGTLSRG